MLDGFICSDLIDIGGYSSLAPFGCITETSGILDGAGIAGFGGWMCGVCMLARFMRSSGTLFPHPMPSWCISTSRREQSRLKVCKSTDDARKVPVLIGGRGVDSRSDMEHPLHCHQLQCPSVPCTVIRTSHVLVMFFSDTLLHFPLPSLLARPRRSCTACPPPL